MMNSQLTFSYTTAIFLNNIGINLLEQYAYRDALDTFTDSITIMRSLMGQELHEIKDVNAMIHKAQRRVLSPQKCEQTCTINVGVYDGSSLQHNSLYQNNTQVHGSGLLEASVVHIEWNEELSVEERDQDLESAIMLYNFSRAHLCLASSSPCERKSRKLQSGALKLLELSYNIIAGNNGLSRFHEYAEQVLEQRLRLSILVLQEMTRVLENMGDFQQSRQCKDRLAQLTELAVEIDQDDFDSDVLVSCAAAA